VEANVPFLTQRPRLALTLAGTAALGGAYLYRRHARTRGLERAAALLNQVGWEGCSAGTHLASRRRLPVHPPDTHMLVCPPPPPPPASAPYSLSQVRVVKQQPPETLAAMLAALFSAADSADTIRQLCIGVSAHQKLDLLASLVRLLGFESLAVFGDCFDEVGGGRRGSAGLGAPWARKP
jgi:hypothetical protein